MTNFVQLPSKRNGSEGATESGDYRPPVSPENGKAAQPVAETKPETSYEVINHTRGRDLMKNAHDHFPSA